MAFKIKDNLDLYGNQLLNFALQSDSGFPQSPQVGHMFNYTGTGVMANHAVMCVDETTKAFKALAFVDEIATNTAFTELDKRVQTIEKALGEDTANVIDTWEEIQNFLKDIDANDANLMTMLNSKLDKSGGTIEGGMGVLNIKRNVANFSSISFENTSGLMGYLGFYRADQPAVRMSDNTTTHLLLHSGNYSDYALPKSGGILRDSWSGGTEIRRADSNNGNVMLSFSRQDGTIVGGLGFGGIDNPIFVTQAGGQNTLLHSGNIGEYAIKTDGSNKMAKDALITWTDGGGNSYDSAAWGTKVYTANNASNSLGLINANYSTLLNIGTGVSGYNYQLAGTTDYKNLLLFRTYYATQGKWNDWKTIAFTDSDITGNAGSATKLETARTIWGNSFDGTGNIEITTSGLMRSLGFTGTDNATQVGYVGRGSNSNNDIVLAASTTNGNVRILAGGNSDKSIYLNSSGNVGIGTPDPQKKLHVVGDLYVEGNIIATKEVSAGGAGQEGESGDGGAEVISQQLASGQSTYTITNTIKRSDIAVSLYEWNANNGSWDMCLADISVKDATITVTFGSATSVNHKLVAVG